MRHNHIVGNAFREVVRDAYRMGCNEDEVDVALGQQVNYIAQHAYDLGAREAVQPHRN
jgi:hypothetical protein